MSIEIKSINELRTEMTKIENEAVKAADKTYSQIKSAANSYGIGSLTPA
jgi:effector-binding domain-containing protein